MAAELLVRIFESEIVPEIFPNNSIVNFAVSDDDNVRGNTVETQNAGTLPAVLVDNTTWPLTVSQRTDTPDNYQIETLNTEVTQITDVEALIETGGRNKRSDITMQQSSALRTKAVSRLLVDWLTGVTNAIPTTGAGAPATLPGATGNRRAITRIDILNALESILDQDIPVDGVNQPILVIPSRFWRDLMNIDEFIEADKLGVTRGPLISGQIGEILNCKVMVRSLVARTDSADVLKAEEAAGAAGDQHAAILYHPLFVRKAMGAFKVRIDVDRPEYGGTILGSELRFGGNAMRLDKKGIAMIFEDTV